MRHLRIGMVGLGLIIGGSASAQERWSVPEVAVLSGGEVCASTADEDARACFAVGCLGAAPLAFHLYLPGTPTPEVFGATVEVDGGSKSVLVFDTVRDPENHRSIVTAETVSLLENLGDGGHMAVTVVLDDRVVIAEFTLAESRVAIDRALASCPMQDISVPPAGAAEVLAGSVAMLDGEDGFSDEEAALAPVARAYSAIGEQCAMQGEGATIGPDFARRTDIDGDGLEDLILDWGGAACPSASYCSAEGCQHEIWLRRAAAEGYDLILAQNLREAVVLAPSRISLQRTGVACGLPESETCEQAFAVVGRELVLVD